MSTPSPTTTTFLDTAFTSTAPVCLHCGQAAAYWNQTAFAFLCARCVALVEQDITAWRARLVAMITERFERWSEVVPANDLIVLLLALLDNNVQAAFNLQDRVINLEEGALLLRHCDDQARRALLAALVAHRLSDSLLIWQFLTPQCELASTTPAPMIGDAMR